RAARRLPGRLRWPQHQDRGPFTFQGTARPARWEDTEPVTVWWSFSSVVSEQPEDQGAGLTANADVERAAVDHVTGRYRSLGWEVTSVESQRIGYDLRCVRGPEEVHVEVKGVAGAVPGFMLTEGERRAAANDPSWRVAVVTDALGQTPRCLEV